jgi:hypothetical protein
MGEKIKETAGEYFHELREVGERAWEATQRTVLAAGTRAAQYGRLVQRRLDLAAVDRKIDGHHRELGRLVSVALRQGTGDISVHPEVRDLIAKLATLDEERISLTREIETLRAETASANNEGQQGEDVPPPDSASRTGEEEKRHP